MRLLTAKAIWFVLAGAVAMIVYFLTYGLRYGWYLSPADSAFLKAVYVAFTLLIIGLWVFFPSRILVGAIGFLGLLFPSLYDSSVFVKMDWQFAPFVLLSVGLLVGATELRRRAL